MDAFLKENNMFWIFYALFYNKISSDLIDSDKHNILKQLLKAKEIINLSITNYQIIIIISIEN